MRWVRCNRGEWINLAHVARIDMPPWRKTKAERDKDRGILLYGAKGEPLGEVSDTFRFDPSDCNKDYVPAAPGTVATVFMCFMADKARPAIEGVETYSYPVVAWEIDHHPPPTATPVFPDDVTAPNEAWMIPLDGGAYMDPWSALHENLDAAKRAFVEQQITRWEQENPEAAAAWAAGQ
jgi:hypothetical protein